MFTTIEIFKSPSFWGITISAIVAIITFCLNKRAEREAEWRKEKRLYYKELLSSIDGILIENSSAENQRRFNLATNLLPLVASQQVLTTVDKYRSTTSIENFSKKSNEKFTAEHNQAHDALLLSIRADLGIKPKDKRNTFSFPFFASRKNNDGNI